MYGSLTICIENSGLYNFSSWFYILFVRVAWFKANDWNHLIKSGKQNSAFDFFENG